MANNNETESRIQNSSNFANSAMEEISHMSSARNADVSAILLCSAFLTDFVWTAVLSTSAIFVRSPVYRYDALSLYTVTQLIRNMD